MYIIAGLGNPGPEYEKTRHNIGFLTVNALAESLGTRVDHAKFNALVADVRIGMEKCLLMKPQTYMNNSGEAVGAAARFYKVPPENVIIISDDITLEPGVIRIRRKGSAGGHNGLKSIIAHLSSENFLRVKIGVGERRNTDSDLCDHVLGTFSKADIPVMNEAIKKAVEAVKLIVTDDVSEAMNRYNEKPKPKEKTI